VAPGLRSVGMACRLEQTGGPEHCDSVSYLPARRQTVPYLRHSREVAPLSRSNKEPRTGDIADASPGSAAHRRRVVRSEVAHGLFLKRIFQKVSSFFDCRYIRCCSSTSGERHDRIRLPSRLGSTARVTCVVTGVLTLGGVDIEGSFFVIAPPSRLILKTAHSYSCNLDRS
jgi:hypothetical protein